MRKWRGNPLVLLVSMGLASFSGCWQETKAPVPSVPSFSGLTLEIGALENTAILAGVKAQTGEWVASRGGKVAIHSRRCRPNPSGRSISCCSPAIGWANWWTPMP